MIAGPIAIFVHSDLLSLELLRRTSKYILIHTVVPCGCRVWLSVCRFILINDETHRCLSSYVLGVNPDQTAAPGKNTWPDVLVVIMLCTAMAYFSDLRAPLVDLNNVVLINVQALVSTLNESVWLQVFWPFLCLSIIQHMYHCVFLYFQHPLNDSLGCTVEAFIQDFYCPLCVFVCLACVCVKEMLSPAQRRLTLTSFYKSIVGPMFPHALHVEGETRDDAFSALAWKQDGLVVFSICGLAVCAMIVYNGGGIATLLAEVFSKLATHRHFHQLLFAFTLLAVCTNSNDFFCVFTFFFSSCF